MTCSKPLLLSAVSGRANEQNFRRALERGVHARALDGEEVRRHRLAFAGVLAEIVFLEPVLDAGRGPAPAHVDHAYVMRTKVVHIFLVVARFTPGEFFRQRQRNRTVIERHARDHEARRGIAAQRDAGNVACRASRST